MDISESLEPDGVWTAEEWAVRDFREMPYDSPLRRELKTAMFKRLYSANQT